jgi:hypothetical protein
MPQFESSVRVSVQVPLQFFSLAPQHLPFEQLFEPHGTPQAPQFDTFDFVSTQVPPQFVWPDGQHFELEQTLLLPQSAVLQQVPLGMQAPPHRW